MARPKSEDKRKAILDAAVAVFAERGVWSTPTSAISKAAGVAEGTLFTYFATKENLMNELYRVLKTEVAHALLATFPADADVRTRVQHFWHAYVRWGIAYPDKLKVLAQLRISDQVTDESRTVGLAPFVEIERMGSELTKDHQMPDYPIAFISALFESMAETTIAIIAQDRNSTFDYSAAGFNIFWNGIIGR